MTEVRRILVADGLNATNAQVNAAMMAGDAEWLRQRARLYESVGCDAIDVCAASAAGAEAAILEWALESVEPFVRCQIMIDSADPEVLARAMAGRSRPAILNSIDCGEEWPESLLGAARERAAAVVLQARRGSELPRDVESRLRWLTGARAALIAGGVQADRIWLDPVALPWGDDFEAGRVLLDAVEGLGGECPESPVLVAISNLGWGHPRRREIQRRWAEALVARGLGVALFDASDAQLLRILTGQNRP